MPSQDNLLAYKVTEAIAELRKLFPGGHEKFIPLAVGDIVLHAAKNADYSGGRGSPLGNFFRVGHILSLYPGLDPSDPTVVALTYMMKQLDAVFQLLATHKEGQVEGVAQRLGDVSVYAKLALLLHEEQAMPTPEYDLDEDEEEMLRDPYTS